MAILKTVEGLIQLDRCPVCGYLVFWTDMDYEAPIEPEICRFCRVDRECRREERKLRRARKRAFKDLRLTMPCYFCSGPIPSSGIFGLPTYTDVPENHAEDCPVREIMEVRLAQEDSPRREKEGNGMTKDEDRVQKVLGKICRYLLQKEDFTMPPSLWHEMLDMIPENERKEMAVDNEATR